MFSTVGGLEASDTYWAASPKKRALNCNGAGTAGWEGCLVPDTIWGLNINAAANIHDWDYGEGQTLTDKDAADFRFQKNMIVLIRQAAKRSWVGWALKIPREHRACLYFMAVIEADASIEAFMEAEIL
jgi:hypothetical protein